MAGTLPIARQLAKVRRWISTIREDIRGVKRTNEDLLRAMGGQFGEGLLTSLRYADPRKLNHYELQVFSQGGEDGIIAEIFRRIGTTDRRFVEFGIQDGLETNTTYLLSLGWSGLWIDADRKGVEAASERFRKPLMEGRLAIRQAFVTADNAADLLLDAATPPEFDLLSLDIDRNTYYLWRALQSYRPRVLVVEYNGSIPPSDAWVVEYAPDKVWNRTVYYGASLKSYELLGRKMGYCLVGCNLSGVNAFFVREDLVGERFLPPFTAEHHHEPPRYWLRWRAGHCRGFED